MPGHTSPRSDASGQPFERTMLVGAHPDGAGVVEDTGPVGALGRVGARLSGRPRRRRARPRTSSCLLGGLGLGPRGRPLACPSGQRALVERKNLRDAAALGACLHSRAEAHKLQAETATLGCAAAARTSLAGGHEGTLRAQLAANGRNPALACAGYARPETSFKAGFPPDTFSRRELSHGRPNHHGKEAELGRWRRTQRTSWAPAEAHGKLLGVSGRNQHCAVRGPKTR
jgi:hypothetical protein